jgi:hypothetical protein
MRAPTTGPRRGWARELFQRASQAFEIALIHVEELRFRLHAARRLYHELDTAVVRYGAPLGEAELLETIDDPRRVGHIPTRQPTLNYLHYIRNLSMAIAIGAGLLVALPGFGRRASQGSTVSA